MKRKRPVPAPAPAAAPAAPAPARFTLPGWVVPALLALGLYFTMFLPTTAMGMITVFAALVIALAGFKWAAPRMQERLGVPALLLVGWFLLLGLSAIYAPNGTNAAGELPRYLASLPVAMLALVWVDRRNLRAVLWVLAALAALLGLVCVDSSATGVLYRGFSAVMDAMGADFGSVPQYVGAGRINGLYNNANITSGIFAMGGLLSIWLTRTGERKWERGLGCFLTGVLAMSFFLSMSRGAILCFGVTLIVYAAVTHRADRLGLVFFLIETVVLTVILSALAMKFLGSDGSVIPDLLTLVCGGCIAAADRFAGRPAAAALAGKGKAIALVSGGLAALAVIYAVAALNITGDFRGTSGQRLYRTVDLPAGTWTMTVDYDGEVEGEVVAVLSRDTVRGSTETLFSGPLADAELTVPEGTVTVEVSFYPQSDSVIRSIEFSDGTSVPMSFPLIPSFLANRLQEGLFTGSSFSLRAQYVKDGLALFAERPLLGWGLGGTQSWLMSVQPFYYEVVYLHNHIVEAMACQGLVGLVLFAGALLGAAWQLIRALRRDRTDSLAAVLLAVWVMMNLHSVMEINFAHRGYQVYAYVLLAVMLAVYPSALPDRSGKWLGRAGAGVLAAWLAFFGVTFELHRMAADDYENMTYFSNAQVMSDTKRCADRDIYDPENAQVSFVTNATALGDPKYNADTQRYVKALRDSGTRYACSSLVYGYYLPRGEVAEAFDALEQGILSYAAHRDIWSMELLAMFEQGLPSLSPEQFPEFVTGMEGTFALLADYNADRQEPVDLAILVQDYYDTMEQAAKLSPEEGYQLMLETMAEANDMPVEDFLEVIANG